MNDAARRVVASGRYGDDTLLHVNRKELEGLERIIGRPLTYNPQTGLPEAFGWTDIIPVVAGIAGGVVGGPLGAAAASGVASAGVSAAKGEDMETALTKGLISGVTSYAGGSLLSGVGDAAAGAAGNALGSAAGEAGAGAAADITANTAVGAAAGSADLAAGAATAAPLAAPAVDATVQGTGVGMANVAGGASPSAPSAAGYNLATGAVGDPTAVTPSSAGFMDRASASFDRGLARVDRVMNDPGAAVDKFASNIYNSPRAAGIAALGTYAQMSGMLDQPGTPAIKRDEYDPSKYPEAQSRLGPVVYPGADYRPGVDPEFNYFPQQRFAEGGIARMPTRNVPQYGEAENVVAEARAAMLGEHPARGEAMSRLRDRMGPDTVRSVREEGGRVRGAGGGLDDLVPGTIEGRQRVRLADGEFVVPSDVVSGLGDGSTDQGARKLHEMMSRVRQKRHGSTKQPGRVGRSVMPA